MAAKGRKEIKKTNERRSLENKTTEGKFSSLAEAQAIYAAIPSFRLKQTRIPGNTFKIIGKHLKKFNIDLNEMLNTSIATIYRQYKKEDIDLSFKDGLINLLRILNKGIKAFDSEDDFKEWLFLKVENLGNQKPIDLLALESGRREVEEMLDRIEYGIYG